MLTPLFVFEIRNRLRTKKKDIIFLEKINNILNRKEIYVEIGSGSKKGTNNWITIDLANGADIQMNLLQKWPFPDNTITKIYSSHFLEHFSIKDIKFILSECHRVLKEDGSLITCVPDASIYIKAYTNNETLDLDNWLRYKPAVDFNTKIDYINYIGYMAGVHKHMFDIENLIQIQKRCGFKNVTERNIDPALDKIERDYESIYTIAKK